MTKQGYGPGAETPSDLGRQPSIVHGLEVSSSLSSKTRALHDIACRRRCLAILGISLGCLVASALIVGLVEGVQAYHDLHINAAQALSAQTAGEYQQATTIIRSCCLQPSDAHMLVNHVSPVCSASYACCKGQRLSVD